VSVVDTLEVEGMDACVWACTAARLVAQGCKEMHALEELILVQLGIKEKRRWSFVGLWRAVGGRFIGWIEH